MKKTCHRLRKQCHKPHEIVGAGDLTATIWKKGDEHGGWRYHFNVYRQSCRSGAVSQLFRPGDVIDFIKLCQVLAMTLADDGCLEFKQRRQLAELAARLDSITRNGA
jgi:hypothetical protein